MFDIHLHVAGVGAENSGCYFDPSRMRSLGFRLIRRAAGLTAEEVRQRLDPVIREQLLGHLSGVADLGGVVLAMDWARDHEGEILKSITDFHVPNDYVLTMAAQHERLHAGVSIHPFRKDAVEEMERCAKAGAVLLKWLPVCQNFSPADPRCLPLFECMAALKIPLLCHTGSEGATRVIDKSWNDPKLLRPALDAGVSVIAAHCGMSSGPHDKDYLEDWIAMLKDYPHFWGDTSSWFGLRGRKGMKALGRENVMDRLIHGSDWPVPNTPWWYVGLLPISRIRTLAKVQNPLLRDIETKKAIGIVDEVFSRAKTVLSLEL